MTHPTKHPAGPVIKTAIKEWFGDWLPEVALAGIGGYVLTRLQQGGFHTIDLADPDAIDSDGTREFSDGSVAGTVNVHPGDGVVYHGGWEWTYEQARDVARQWLSAAEVAGENKLEKGTIGIHSSGHA